MTEAREVPNAHLTNVRGLSLKREHRDRLRDNGLIKVRQERKGGPAFLELTDRGWARGIAEFGQPVPPRAGSAGAALYAILETLGRFIKRSDIAPADFFIGPEEPEGIEVAPDLESLIRKAYGEVAPESGAWVTLDKLRQAIGPAPRNEVDAALIRLNQAPDVRLIPESNQKVLTDAVRAAAVSIGNQDKHAIAIGV
jgi:hypothetical protein